MTSLGDQRPTIPLLVGFHVILDRLAIPNASRSIMRTPTFLTFAFTCCAFALSDAARSEDWLPRDQTSLDQWDVVRPVKGCIRTHDNLLRIRNLPGDFHGTAEEKIPVKNLLLRDLPKGNFTATLLVSHRPTQAGEMVGLYLYRDDAHFFGVTHGLLDSMNATGVFCTLEHKNLPQVSKHHRSIGRDADLRIEVTGRIAVGYFRQQGNKDFTKLGRLFLPHGDKPLRLAIVAHGAAESATHWATYHSLDVLKRDEDREWDGAVHFRSGTPFGNLPLRQTPTLAATFPPAW